ncbi:MAG: Hsp20/alpha crystallin family protein [Chitinophagales bacterium]
MERASVNMYRTDTGYEMLVFAPGRIKDHFDVQVKGNSLTVSYRPPEGFPRPDWVHREYSRGGFVRSFNLDERFDAEGISADYVDGVLLIHIPYVAGAAEPTKKVDVK